MAALGNYFDTMAQEAADHPNRPGVGDSTYWKQYLYKCVDAANRPGSGVIEFIKNCANGNKGHCSYNAWSDDSCEDQ